MPHVRTSVHPDLLSRLLALTSLMRLSLMKAAHASVGGASCRKSGTMGRKRWAKPFNRFEVNKQRTEIVTFIRIRQKFNKSVRGAAPCRFRPTYAGANMGHPSHPL